MRARPGFSLVELMIVVAILGILAAIAVPNFQTMQLKAKRAEALVVMRGIGDAEVAYQATSGAWIEAASNPGTSLTKVARAWNTSKAGWSSLGFRPDGDVRCNYRAQCQGGACNAGGSYVRVWATCDIDDDATGSAASQGTANIYYYVANGDPDCCGSYGPGTIRDVDVTVF